MIVSLAILFIIGILATALAQAALSVTQVMLGLGGSPEGVLHAVKEIYTRLPFVIVLTLLWNLVGGVYLLLRYDAGGQEVEDLWQPAPPAKSSLPDLPPH